MLIKKKYKNLLENRSMFGLLRDFGQDFCIKAMSDKEIYSIGLEGEGIKSADDNGKKKGGIIVFSTDVNAVNSSPNVVINWVTKTYHTLKNRINKCSILDRLANKNSIKAMTVGYYLQGRYTSDNGDTFTERSISVEVIGVTQDTLFSLAEDICREFHQESVLVKSYDGGLYLVDNK